MTDYFIQAERIAVNYQPTPLQQHPNRGKGKNRVCAQPDCDTVLSVYNRASTCWIHTVEPMRPVDLRGLKDSADQKKRVG